MSTIVISSSFLFFLAHFLTLSLSLYSRKILHTHAIRSPVYFFRHFFSRFLFRSCSLSYFSLPFSFARSQTHTHTHTHTQDRAYTFAQHSHNKHTRTEISLVFSFFSPLFLFVVDVAPFFRFEHFFGEVGVRLCHFLSFR